jgi:hypothetical protein
LPEADATSSRPKHGSGGPLLHGINPVMALWEIPLQPG